MRKEFTLEGLDCANCALKIEDSLNDIKNIHRAYVNFVDKRLILEYTNTTKEAEIINEAKEIINNIEKGVRIIERGSNRDMGTSGRAEINIQIGKLIISLILFASAFIINFGDIWKLSIFSVAYILAGGEVIYKAARNLFKGRIFDENFLMTIATLGAFAIGDYPEAAAVMIFFNIGELFQSMAVDHSRRSIKSLMDIRPEYANIIVDNEIQVVPPEEVDIGTVIVIKPGERVPLDGTVVKGETIVDTSALTGESMPWDVKTDDKILSGFINKSKMIYMRVDKRYYESTVTKILDQVENAALKKAPTENFITKFAKVYTPAVVFIAVSMAIIPTMVYGYGTFNHWLYKALIFLVISCPCALVISIPLSFFGGIGNASKKGILVKGGNYLEALNNIGTVVFDKTGTLTEGTFKVSRIYSKNDFEKDEVLRYAALAESFSDHPIGLSIKNAYNKEIDLSTVLSHEEILGFGIKVRTIDGDILAGNNKLMEKEGIKFERAESIGTIVHVAIHGMYAGYILISDNLKQDSKDTIERLKKAGIEKVAMLTGDGKFVALSVSEQLGLDEVYYELLPEGKVEILEKLKKERKGKGNVIFLGDGINDAPVLAMADVGIAMGGLGSDAAIEASDIVLMTDEPSKLLEAIKVAKFTRKIVWQNIILALGVKFAVLILGFFGIATMWGAVFADVGVALIAVLNAIRAVRY